MGIKMHRLDRLFLGVAAALALGAAVSGEVPPAKGGSSWRIEGARLEGVSARGLYASSPLLWDGPEGLHRITLTETAHIYAALDAGGDLGLFLLRGADGSGEVLAFGHRDAVAFDLPPGEYAVAVESRGKADVPYSLLVSTGPRLDCSHVEALLRPGDEIHSTTALGRNAASRYAHMDEALRFDGAEVVFEFFNPAEQDVAFRLNNPSGAPLRMFLLDRCDEGTVRASAQDAILQHRLPYGEYYLVVESESGEAADFTLHIQHGGEETAPSEECVVPSASPLLVCEGAGSGTPTEPPVLYARFGAPASARVGEDVCFDDRSHGAEAAAWSWNFGDGGTSAESNPCHRYEAPGVYVVLLTARDGEGRQSPAHYRSVQILPPGADGVRASVKGSLAGGRAVTADGEDSPASCASFAGTDFYFAMLEDVAITYFNAVTPPGNVVLINPDVTEAEYLVTGAFTKNGFIPPQGSVSFSIPASATIFDAGETNAVVTKGIRVQSVNGVPVLGYAIFPRDVHWTQDSHQLMPTALSGTEYIGANFRRSDGLGWPPTEIVLLANSDNTEVTVYPSGLCRTNTTPTTFTFHRGDVYVYTCESNLDITGTRVVSNKPITAFQWRQCTYVPASPCCCDKLLDPALPTDLWDTEYFVTPLPTGSNANAPSVVRVVPVENNTAVYINGSFVATVNAGSFYQNSLTANNLNYPIRITTSKPVQVYQFAESYQITNTGDPFMMMAVPKSFYTNTSYFYTYFGYDNYVNIVAPASATSSVKINGVAPTATWQAFPDTAQYVWLRQPLGLGVFYVEASAPVSTMVYGVASESTPGSAWMSYGHAAGGFSRPLAGFASGSSDDSVCLGQAFNFSDSSVSPDQTVIAWHWDFGDGVGTSTLQNPSYTYTAPGTYVVTLWVETECVKSLPVSRQVQVRAVPTAYFTTPPGCVGQPLCFTDASTNGPTQWYWDFGDGVGTSEEQNPCYTYAATGSYMATLIAVNMCGVSKSYQAAVEIFSTPQAAFNAPDSACLNEMVSFADASTGNPVAWSWDFGDGGASSLQNPAHAYAKAGDYTVRLSVTNACGTVSEAVGTIAIVNLPEASFTTDAPKCFGVDITFTDASTGDPVAWNWSFGDGATSTEQNPTHAYAAAGTYAATLAVTNACGASTVFLQNVLVFDRPQANFVAPASGCVNTPVSFTDASTADPTTWAWDFGDGSTATVQNPSHAYAAAGTYTVALTASNACGASVSVSKVINILGTPEAAFTHNAPQCLGDTISFTDSSTGTITGWSWNFGDGLGTSNSQNPSYTYTKAGTYTVTLRAFNSCGVSAPFSLQVSVPRAPATAFAAPSDACAGASVSFADQSPYAPTAWAWDFGDGNASTEQNPAHVYTVSGTYTATLVASNACGSGNAVSKAVVVHASISTSFASTSPDCLGATTFFTDTSVGQIDSWFWDFGDGNASTKQHPGHVYTTAGTYAVTLTTSNFCGAFTASGAVEIIPSTPTAGFAADKTSACVNEPVCFTNLSSGADAYFWDFGTGVDFSSAVNPCFAWAEAGTYIVTLTASNACGASAPTSFTVTINPVPVASFSYSSTGNKFCRDKDVQFTDVSSNNPTSWFWDFGDGTTSTAQNPVHQFAVDGVFVVTLVASNACGAGLPISQEVIIHASCQTNCSANSRIISCQSGAPVVVNGNTLTNFDNYNTSFYPCRPEYFYSGNNATHRLDATDGSTYRITIEKTGADPDSYELDLILSQFCTPPECVAWGDSELIFDTTLYPPKTGRYFLIVDGRDGTDGPYQLTVECIPPSQQTQCTAPTFGGVTDVSDNNACTYNGLLISWEPVTDWGTGMDGSVCTDGTYEVYRALASDTSLQRVIGSSLTGTSYVDTSVVPNTEYVYWVHAVNSCCGKATITANYLPGTDRSNATPTFGGLVSATDENVCADAGVLLAWNASPDLGGGVYRVYRSPYLDCTAAVLLAELPATETAYLDNSSENNVLYYYRVAAVTECGIISDGGAGCLAAADYVSTPPVFLGVDEAADADLCSAPSGIEVSWREVLQPSDWGGACTSGYYNIHRDGALLISGLLFSPYLDVTVQEGVVHSYRVEAVNSCCGATNDGNGRTVSASDGTAEAPAFAGLESAEDMDPCADTGVRLTWSAVADWGSGTDGTYNVYRDGVLIVSGLTGSSYVDAGGTNEVLYAYRVEAVNAACGAASDGGATRSAMDSLLGTPPASSFAAPTFACAGLEVFFADASTGGATAWAWDFGDGNVSTEQNPTHVYAAAGTYAVTLVASNSCGAGAPFSMDVQVGAIPEASFSAPLGECTGNAVAFTDTSALNPTAWAWDFGDGTVSTEQNPSHVYAIAGTYVVTLWTSNDCGVSGPFLRSIEIIETPVAGFAHNAPQCTGNGVSFLDASTGNPTAWTWDFGDGTTSTLQNPTHAYAAAGTYTVTLTAQVFCGASAPFSQTLDIYPAPVASFTHDGPKCAGASVQFTDASTGSPTAWQWDFGDGTASTEQNPSHAYAAPGIYSARLIASNGCGVSAAFTQSVVVLPPPASSFTHDAPKCAGAPVSFTDASAGTPVAWAWNFGDGNSSTEQNPSHAYAVPGEYTVSLTASNACGAGAAFSAKVQIAATPVSAFGHNAPKCIGQSLTFLDASTGTPTAWEWDFGDGNVSSVQNPVHAYAAAGTYTVTLTASNACGTGSAASAGVTVLAPSSAAFAHDAPKCAGSPVQFMDTSTQNPTQWFWDFGDGAGTSTLQHPAYAYALPGAYTVTLTVTNACGPQTASGNVQVLNDSFSFGGLKAVEADTPCGLTLSWDAAQPGCQNGELNDVVYNVYRSQDINFTPNAASLLASCVGGLSYVDLAVVVGQTYHYIVRAETSLAGNGGPCGGGLEDVNTVRRSGVPATALETIFFDDMESGANGWTASSSWQRVANSICSNPDPGYTSPVTSWYAGSPSACSLVSGTHDLVSPTITGITSVSILNFKHWWHATSCGGNDTASVSVSTNGGASWTQVFFRDTSVYPLLEWENSGDISLAVYEGQSIRLRFRFTAFSTCTAPQIGWFLDDVLVANKTAEPLADFDAVTPGCVGAPMAFTDNSIGQVSAWFWDFGDGNTSTEQSPSHAYASAGTYTVTLIASNTCASDSVEKTVSVTENSIEAAFSWPASACAGQGVAFSDASANAVSWSWDFGDGNTSTAQNPTHAYAAPGTYTATLTASNSCGNSASVSQDVIVTASPVASFDAPVSTCGGQSVQFTDLSTNEPTSWAWDFGDGNTSTEQNPAHAYASAGTYTVTLTASNGCGASAPFSTDVVVAAPAPAADFGAAPSPSCVGQAVQFTDLSTNNPTSWVWDFGDGNASTVQNPAHAFMAAGDYAVTLTASNACGVSAPVSKSVQVGAKASSSFSHDGPKCAEQAVQFTDLSTSAPTSWTWDFGDGNTSTEQNPAHAYAAPGTYTITLTASNACGGAQTSQSMDVPAAPASSFTHQTACGSATVQFTDASTNAPTSWTWDFGDGNTSTEQNPAHTYAASGTYTVMLTASNACGNGGSVQYDVTTDGAPTAAFAGSGVGCAGQTYQFTDSSADAASWSWDFGDGNTSTEQNPAHTYPASGTYVVTLTASNVCGDGVASADVVIASGAPAAGFLAPSGACAGAAAQFTDLSTDASSWSWNFGGGNTSTEQNPAHTYAAPGTYTVTLVASNVCGAGAPASQNVAVGGAPGASFAHDAPKCQGQAVQFADISTGGATAWSWDFGDGNTSTEQNPSHAYAAPGTYTATLTASNVCGASALALQAVTVSAVPMALFASNSPVNVGYPVNFTNYSSGGTPSLFYLWNFGDGNASTDANPSHFYASAGVYTVTLTVTDSAGCAASYAVPVEVREPAVNYLSHVIDDSVGGDGDGQVRPGETVTVPVTLVNASGTFASNVQAVLSTSTPGIVILTDTASYGSIAAGATDVSDPPHFVFTADATVPCGSVIDFTLTITATEGTWTSVFQVSVQSGTLQAETFPACCSSTTAGSRMRGNTYQFTSDNVLTEQRYYLNIPSSTTVYFFVYEHTALTGTYTLISNVPVTTGTGAQFYSSGPISVPVSASKYYYIGVAWQPSTIVYYYGSAVPIYGQFATLITGSWANSTYPPPPTYTQATSSFTYGPQILQVGAECDVFGLPPVPAFSMLPNPACAGVAVQFTDESTGAPTSWLWDFGDGTTSTMQNPSHVHSSAGEYTVTLTVSDADGSASTGQILTVLAAPAAAFFVSGASCVGSSVQFTDESTNVPTSWLWNFGDGNSSSTQNPSHIYAAGGTYTVTLTASNACGLSVTSQMIVLGPPVPDFTFTPDPACPGGIVQFTDASTGGATAWAWDFGDGAVSSLQNPAHVYAASGTYAVSLAVSDGACGWSAPTAKSVNVTGIVPAAAFTHDGPKCAGSGDYSIAPTAYNYIDATVGTNAGMNCDDCFLSIPLGFTFTFYGNNYTSVYASSNGLLSFGAGSSVYTNAAIPSTALPNNFLAPFWDDLTIYSANGSILYYLFEGTSPNRRLTIEWYSVRRLGYTGPGRLQVTLYEGTNEAVFRYADVDFGSSAVNNGASATIGIENSGGTTGVQYSYNTASVSAGTALIVSMGDPIQFTDTSAGGATAWAWDFGDGATSTVQNPSHAYTNPGEYTVTLTTSGVCGSSQFSETVTILAEPTSDFTWTSSCGSTGVQFTDASAGTPTVWTWNFGDGNASTAQNPFHVYALTGTYTVTLAASNMCGSGAAVLKTVSTDAPPVAAFTHAAACEGQATQFTDASTGGATSWAWDFGDGNVSTEQNPAHVYAAPGIYPVTLTVSNACGTSTPFPSDVQISSVAPSAAFSHDGPWCVGQVVQFTDASTGGATSWAWDFGDGNVSTEQNPAHVYVVTGSYTATLVASNACGASAPAAQAVAVNGVPAGAFSVSGPPCANSALAFTDASTDGATAWTWDFGDGNVSTEQNPAHGYAAVGDYTVTLVASNVCGAGAPVQQVVFITDVAPASAFVHDGPKCFGEAVQFMDASTGGATAWAWDFGDGNTSTQQNPLHVYAVGGVYSVTLIAANACGAGSSFTQGVEVLTAPLAAFSAPAAVCVGQTFQFMDASTGGATAWQWDFGDGNTSTEQNPTHAYAAVGDYTVTLVASNPCGAGAPYATVVTVVDAAPTTSFTFSSPACRNQPVQFTDTSSGAASWQWNFGDGNISTEQNPTHVYAATGNYNVTLTTSNGCGVGNTVSAIVQVRAEPFANFSHDAPKCEGQAVSFIDGSVGNPTAWAWDFGDGNVSTERHPAHTYVSAGTYAVTLTASNACGAAIASASVTINPSEVTALFTHNAPKCVGQAVQFTDVSTGGPTSWFWDFGNGVTSTQRNPSHAYAAAGTYTVTLTASSSCDSDAYSTTVQILAGIPVAAFDAPLGVCLGNPVTFTDDSTNNPTSWQWDFGDGNTSTLQSPTHTYTSGGTYVVTLTASNTCGASVPVSASIEIAAATTPTAAFNHDAPRCLGQAVQFTDTSTGGAVSWGWDFGDGNISTEQNPPHVYAATGDYTVTLTVVNACGLSAQTSQAVSVVDAVPLSAFTHDGPKCAGTADYSIAPTVYNYINATVGTNAGMNCDDCFLSIPLGFTFTFYGNNYTSVYASSNGLLSFGAGSSAYTNVAIPSTALPNNFLTPFWDDLTVYSANGSILYYLLEGTSPNRRLTIEWYNVRRLGYTGPGRLQVTLYEGTNEAVFRYADVDFGSSAVNNGASATIGIENSGGTAGVQYSYNTASVSAGVALRVSMGDPVQFTDASTGGATAWEWDFGDGATSTEQHPFHPYASAGTYTVTLTASNACGAGAPAQQTVDILDTPISAFTHDGPKCSGEDVQFTDTSTGGASSWAWDFGDGNTSTEQNPLHVYAAGGTYTVTLTASNVCGAGGAATQAVDIAPGAAAAFTHDGPKCLGQPLQFTDTSTGGVSSWVWDFGDGNVSAEQHPSHVYASAGTYTVTLTVSNPCGFVSQAAQSVDILNAVPLSLFTHDGPKCAGAGDFLETVENGMNGWTLQSTGYTNLWQMSTACGAGYDSPTAWYFGQNATCTFATGSRVAGRLVSPVMPNLPSGAALDFWHRSDTECSTTCTWDKRYVQISTNGGGSWTSIFEVSDSLTWINSGSLSLDAYAGQDVLIGFLFDSMDGGLNGYLGWMVDDIRVVGAGLNPEVQFTDFSTGGAVSWSWDFGDGNTSTEQHPSHPYASAGTYTVTLTTSNACGAGAPVQQTVDILDTPISAFTHDGPKCSGEDIQFTDASTGGASSWAWNFGDGITSTEQNPSHAYASAGTYTVTLTVTNICGTGNPVQQTITVNLGPSAAFSHTAPKCIGQAVQFWDESTGNPVSWAWDFGDGNTSTQQNPSHTYATAGAYTVTLGVDNGCEFVSQTVQFVNILDSGPLAAFSHDGPKCAGQAVQFTDTSTGFPAVWWWDFGDGNTSTSQNPAHAYAVSGTYTVTLTVANSCGAGAPVQQSVTVLSAPSAAFSHDGPKCVGQAVQFMDSTTNSPTSWMWNFGDGNTSTLQNPSHTYAAAGTYTVTLTASNACGASAPVSQAVSISSGASAGFTHDGSKCVGQTVQFADASAGVPMTWSWDFGDGNTSTLQNPSHTYAVAGTYAVVLTVTDSCGNASQHTGFVNVQAGAPEADFSHDGPKCQSGQYVIVPTAYAYIDATKGTAASGIDCDDCFISIPLGFTFTFYGNSYTSVFVSSNGLLTFGAGSSAFNNSSIPSASAPNNYLAPYWDDLTMHVLQGSLLYYLLEGAAPNRRLTIEWYDVRSFGYGGTGRFQVTLYEGTNEAIFRYADLDFGSATVNDGASATIGLEDGSGTTGVQYSFNTASVSAGSALLVTQVPTVQFTDASTGGVTSWAWDFGDGDTSTLQNPAHIYAAAGTYTVTLTAMNACGAAAISKAVDIIAVVPGAVVSPSSICLGTAQDFTASPSGGSTPYLVEWDFTNDGTMDASGESVSHTYSAPGSYTWRCRVTDANGCFAETLGAAQVTASPSVAAVVSPASACEGDVHDFAASPAGGAAPYSVEWDFTNDGTVDAFGTNVSHVYPSAGVHAWRCRVTDANGCIAEFTDSVTVKPEADAAFSHDAPVCAGDAVTFIATQPNLSVSQTALQASAISGLQNQQTERDLLPGFTLLPSMTTTASVAFDVLHDLNVTACMRAEIVAPDAVALVLKDYGATHSASYDVSAFYNTKGPGTYRVRASEYSGIFGGVDCDGAAGTIVLQPSVADTYMRQDTPTTNTGTASFVQLGNGTSSSTARRALMRFDLSSIPAGTVITGAELTLMSTTGSTSRTHSLHRATKAWLQGNGTTGSGATWNTSDGATLWTTPGGDYDAAVLANVDTNGVTGWKTWGQTAALTTVVQGWIDSPTTNYGFLLRDTVEAAGSSLWNYASRENPTSSSRPILTVFAGTAATGSLQNAQMTVTQGVSYQWDFGDGNMSTEQNPSHVYAAPGDYAVQLTVTTECGTASSQQTVQIADSTPPSASFGVSGATCPGQSLQFTDASTGGVSSWTWDFGDGNFSAEQNPAHAYASAGTYTVTLTVVNACGVSDQDAQIVEIAEDSATADFSHSGPVCVGQPVQFTDSSLGVVASWAWDFGDENTSTEQNPAHAYASAGVYTVTLTVSGACGSSATQQTVGITDSTPAAAFTAGGAVCAGQPAQFTDVSTGGATAWAWDFGDGNTSTLQNPEHTYAAEGTYTVTLTASNGCGTGAPYSQDVTTQSDVIPPPVSDTFHVHLSGASDLTFTWDNLPGAWGNYEVVRYDGWPAPPTEAAMDASPVVASSADGATGAVEPNGQQNPPSTVFYKVRATSPCSGTAGPTGNP